MLSSAIVRGFLGQARDLLVVVVTIGSLLFPTSAQAIDQTQQVTLATSEATVATGDTVTLTASMPVAEVGTTSQSLEQEIDPSKLKLTSAEDISYPNGWTLSVSYNGTDFTETLPTTASGSDTSWDKVVKVKATGPVTSVGTDEGYQVTQATASGPAIDPTPAEITASGTGDGQFAFFDEKRTRVFNIYHHASAGNNLDCHWIATGARCPGAPFSLNAATGQKVLGKVINNKVWALTKAGIVCKDISGLSVSANSGSVGDCGSFLATRAFYHASFTDGAAWENDGRFWAIDANTGDAVCFDTATKASCGSFATTLGATNFGGIKEWDGRVYVVSGEGASSSGKLFCYDAALSAPCSGFPASGPKPIASDLASVGGLLPLPNSSGNTVAICAVTTTELPCWDADGNDHAGPVSLINQVKATAPTVLGEGRLKYFLVMVTVGSRVLWSDGNWTYPGYYYDPPPGKAYCWDAALNAGLGGSCAPNGDIGLEVVSNYSVTPDPLIRDCVWVTGHAPVLQTFNLRTGVQGCDALSGPTATFTGSGAVPRMGCATPDAGTIRRWGTLAITNPPAGAWTAKLSVVATDDTLIDGWQEVTLIDGSIDLSSLSVSATGLNPKFNVVFTGLDPSVTSVSANITAVGDAPQLCLDTTAVYQCPSGSGPITALPNATTTVAASGSSVKDSVRTDLTASSQVLGISAPSVNTCGSEIRGRAGDDSLGSGGTSVSGVVVTLLDHNGDPVLDDSSNPITATTAADGSYSFGTVYPGSYKVSFSEPEGIDLQSGTVVSGASGTTTGTTTTAGASVESQLFTTAVGTDAVINALLAIPASAAPDISTGNWDTNQTINPLANDAATTGASFDNSTLKLCAAGESPNSCTATSLTTADGDYSVNGDGTITFDPLPTFSGVVSDPAIYQIQDSSGATVSSTITSAVTPATAPVAAADETFGAAGQNQSINPLTNDTSATSGNAFDAASVKLCSSSQIAPNCTQTSLTIAGQGSYSVDPTTGAITFTPEAGFTGSATPVPYSAQTISGQKASSTYTPTVLGAPNAVDDLSTGPWNQPLTEDVVANDGPGLDVSTLKLCSGNPLSCSTAPVTVGSDGIYSIVGGEIVFTPSQAFIGAATPIVYEIADVLGQTTGATFSPTILPPQPPNAGPETKTLFKGATSVVFTNLDRSAGLAAPVTGGPDLDNTKTRLRHNGATVSSVVTPNGTFSLNTSTGVVSFTPTTSPFLAPTQTVEYEVVDDFGNASSATLTVLLPLPPTAADDRSSGFKGQTQTLRPLGNDSAVNNFSKDPGSLRLCDITATPVESAPNCTATALTIAGEGSYAVDSTTGEVSFVPEAEFLGTATQVTYIFSDSAGSTANATITIVVASVPIPSQGGSPSLLPANPNNPITPQPPTTCAVQILDCSNSVSGEITLAPDSAVGLKGTPVILDPLKNDRAGSGELIPESVSLCDLANCGLKELITNDGLWVVDDKGKVTFTPNDDFTGTTSVNYVVISTDGLSAKSSLKVTINEVQELAQTGFSPLTSTWLVIFLLTLGFLFRRVGREAI